MQILLATTNAHKAAEFRTMLPKNLDLLTLRDIDWTQPIDEPYLTFEENARHKALTLHRHTGLPVLSDDSGLEIDALDKRPGVHSARYAGNEQDDVKNRKKVLLEMAGITNRAARFRAVLVFCLSDVQALAFEGVVEGRITLEERGHGGFGYDPIFIPAGFSHTFGELPLSVKNRISHRARAFEKFLAFLRQSGQPG